MTAHLDHWHQYVEYERHNHPIYKVINDYFISSEKVEKIWTQKPWSSLRPQPNKTTHIKNKIDKKLATLNERG